MEWLDCTTIQLCISCDGCSGERTVLDWSTCGILDHPVCNVSFSFARSSTSKAYSLDKADRTLCSPTFLAHLEMVRPRFTSCQGHEICQRPYHHALHWLVSLAPCDGRLLFMTSHFKLAVFGQRSVVVVPCHWRILSVVVEDKAAALVCEGGPFWLFVLLTT